MSVFWALGLYSVGALQGNVSNVTSTRTTTTTSTSTTDFARSCEEFTCVSGVARPQASCSGECSVEQCCHETPPSCGCVAAEVAEFYCDTGPGRTCETANDSMAWECYQDGSFCVPCRTKEGFAFDCSPLDETSCAANAACERSTKFYWQCTAGAGIAECSDLGKAQCDEQPACRWSLLRNSTEGCVNGGVLDCGDGCESCEDEVCLCRCPEEFFGRSCEKEVAHVDAECSPCKEIVYAAVGLSCGDCSWAQAKAAAGNIWAAQLGGLILNALSLLLAVFFLGIFGTLRVMGSAGPVKRLEVLLALALALSFLGDLVVAALCLNNASQLHHHLSQLPCGAAQLQSSAPLLALLLALVGLCWSPQPLACHCRGAFPLLAVAWPSAQLGLKALGLAEAEAQLLQLHHAELRALGARLPGLQCFQAHAELSAMPEMSRGPWALVIWPGLMVALSVLVTSGLVLSQMCTCLERRIESQARRAPPNRS